MLLANKPHDGELIDHLGATCNSEPPGRAANSLQASLPTRSPSHPSMESALVLSQMNIVFQPGLTWPSWQQPWAP